MGIFDGLLNSKEKDANKKYLSINDKRFDDNDMLKRKDLYEIIKKYQGYENTVDLSNNEEVNKRISCLILELFNIKIMCKNYNEFQEFFNSSNERINNYDILECMAFITYIQRQDYMSGGYGNVYFNNTCNNLLPQLINRIINIYESRGE